MNVFRICAFFVTILLLGAPPAQATTLPPSEKLRQLEEVVRQYFRKPVLSAELANHAAFIKDFNNRQQQAQDELRREGAAIQTELASVKSRQEALTKTEASFSTKRPLSSDVEKYNRDAESLKNDAKALGARIDAFNRKQNETNARFQTEHTNLQASENALMARQDKWKKFNASRGPERLQQDLIDLLADLRGIKRPTQAQSAMLTRVRGLRRELAEWAIADFRAQPNGLWIVEVLVVDEPCWFIFDTGAQTITIPTGIIRALDLEKNLGPEEPIRGVAGLETTGRPIILPRVSVLTQTASQVQASAISTPEGAGIDGLLGRSMLKRFRIMIDPTATPAIRLAPVSTKPW